MGNPGPQGIKGFQVGRLSATVSIFLHFSRLLTACLCVTLQGVKGGLGDPGLPGPTGIRGDFGDRVSSMPRFKCSPRGGS